MIEDKENKPESNGREHEDPTKIDINREDLKKVPKTLWEFVMSMLNMKSEVDVDETIREINEEIEFKGHNVWVLIFSILVCSIGLDADSTAVVIGAMLISPLMGPIKGVGLAIGTNNFKLLMKSLINFGVMVGISLLVSWIYFAISPFKEPSEQILARTQPDFRDALIALFGGFAGIIAATKRGSTFTVISGVAIATALMPPLCSAGFMLANGDFPKLFNASYLFLINSLLICLASLVVIRYLRFPLVQFVNPKTERKVKIYIAIFLLLVLIPSVSQFYSVMKESSFQRQAKEFISKEIQSYPGARLKNWDAHYMQGDSVNVIHIEFRQDGFVSEDMIATWTGQLEQYGLENTVLEIDEGNMQQDIGSISYQELLQREDVWREERRELERELNLREHELRLYEKQLSTFGHINPFRARKLEEEAKVHYPGIEQINFSVGLDPNGMETDTITYVVVNWKPSVTDSMLQIKRGPLEKWLKLDMEDPDLQVIQFLSDGKEQEEED